MAKATKSRKPGKAGRRATAKPRKARPAAKKTAKKVAAKKGAAKKAKPAKARRTSAAAKGGRATGSKKVVKPAAPAAKKAGSSLPTAAPLEVVTTVRKVEVAPPAARVAPAPEPAAAEGDSTPPALPVPIASFTF